MSHIEKQSACCRGRTDSAVLTRSLHCCERRFALQAAHSNRSKVPWHSAVDKPLRCTLQPHVLHTACPGSYEGTFRRQNCRADFGAQCHAEQSPSKETAETDQHDQEVRGARRLAQFTATRQDAWLLQCLQLLRIQRLYRKARPRCWARLASGHCR